MLIYKSPSNNVFDTDTGTQVMTDKERILISQSLNDITVLSNMDYLLQFFKLDSSIYFNFGQSSYWVCELKPQSLHMSHLAALRIMMQVSAGNTVPLADMAAWMGTTPPVLRAHLVGYADEYVQHHAQRYPQRHGIGNWQITDERLDDKYIRMAYAECVFIIKKMLPDIA